MTSPTMISGFLTSVMFPQTTLAHIEERLTFQIVISHLLLRLLAASVY